MSIDIIDAGFQSTIQDDGRWGVQDQGIPISGFMDATSANIANALLGNSKNAPLIEMCAKGITLKAHIPISVAYYGADMPLKLNGETIAQGKSIPLKVGDEFQVGYARKGVYGYLAFKGVLALAKIYNSYSTYLPAYFGGYFGRALQKGDCITLLEARVLPTTTNSAIKALTFLSEITLEVYPGPEWNQLPATSKHKVIHNIFTVSKDINRIGYRLEGEPIELGDQKEIISSGIIKGTVQLTSAGQLIVMMADSPTTGGYLRILNLKLKACDMLAQLPPFGKIKFALVDFKN